MTSSPQINNTAVADGSSTTTSTSTTTPWSCETNWTVTRGSLETAVTFESFDFPIDSESTGPKSPLLLVPHSTSDCEPCEIKLNFTEKHEIRQVYVRSTARNYEIYYATNPQSENEYLCTVRCSAASETDVTKAISVNLEDPNETSQNRKVAGESNHVSTNEDDWVEIKLPVGQVNEGNRNTYSPNQTLKNYQNYYEATAEINDSEPCTSLTLRLVSLQSKAFVQIDEMYVFADCIGTDDSQKQTVTSGGSSLMTMLVPTLLGLSKSRSLQHISKSVETESRPAAESTRCQVGGLSVCDSSCENDFPVNCPENVGDFESGETGELTRYHVPLSTSDKEIPLLTKTFHDTNTVLLEQLVSRVSKIEDILLRFEEKMLNPINNIEARLLHVEQQQVELLAKYSQFPILPSQPKPEYINQLYDDSESENQQDTSEEKQEPPKSEKTKKHVSIDDALAAALEGFSSVTKSNDNFPVLPFVSPQEECLKSPKPIEEEKSEVKETDTVDVLNDSEISDENNKTDDEIVTQESIEEVKILTFDKNDILKHFPDECEEVKNGSESAVDFETCILEVKFDGLENGDLKSHLEAFLSYTDDDKSATIDEGVLMEETTGNGSGLLVELDGDDVPEGVLQDHPETFFDSLI